MKLRTIEGTNAQTNIQTHAQAHTHAYLTHTDTHIPNTLAPWSQTTRCVIWQMEMDLFNN